MDYELLGLGRATSIIADLALSDRGRTLVLSCIYDPLGVAKPYTLVFRDCQELKLQIFDKGAEAAADLIGIALGEGEHQVPATVTTDLWELSVVYGEYIVTT